MREVLTGLAERRLEEVVEARLAEEPVVVLNGPRTVGKSTLLSELAGRLGRAVIDCDDLAIRAAVRSDPARFVESDQPVLIDEYQHVPELLDAIKAQLNRDLRPGRYVLAARPGTQPCQKPRKPLPGAWTSFRCFRFPGRNRRRTRDIRRQAARRRWHRHDPITGRRPATNTLGGRPRAACRWPFAGRLAVPAPDGSPTTSTWSSTRMSWTSHESGSARCSPGYWASSPPDPGKS
jgi:Predicted ATPase (AAA+ superfamily)